MQELMAQQMVDDLRDALAMARVARFERLEFSEHDGLRRRSGRFAGHLKIGAGEPVIVDPPVGQRRKGEVRGQMAG
jgi:hypothetical protein